MRLYAADAGYHVRSLASAGMCWDCETDAEALHVAGCTREGSSQDVWGFDLLVNGRCSPIGRGALRRSRTSIGVLRCRKGRSACRCSSRALRKHGCGSCPWSGESFARKPAYDCRLLCLGDSITQGYTVHFPSLAYANGSCPCAERGVLESVHCRGNVQPGDGGWQHCPSAGSHHHCLWHQ